MRLALHNLVARRYILPTSFIAFWNYAINLITAKTRCRRTMANFWNNFLCKIISIKCSFLYFSFSASFRSHRLGNVGVQRADSPTAEDLTNRSPSFSVSGPKVRQTTFAATTIHHPTGSLFQRRLDPSSLQQIFYKFCHLFITVWSMIFCTSRCLRHWVTTFSNARKKSRLIRWIKSLLRAYRLMPRSSVWCSQFKPSHVA